MSTQCEECVEVTVTVTQSLIHEFSLLTGDTQWIHTDAETPVAHGALLVSLAIARLNALWPFESASDPAATVVTGIRTVIFVRPVHAGDEVRFTYAIDRTSTGPAHEVPFTIGARGQGSQQFRMAVDGTLGLRDVDMVAQ